MSKLYLVGIVHSQTNNYSSGDLFPIINSIKPQIVFIERPSNQDWQILNNSNKDVDDIAIKEYCKNNVCNIISYDIQNRNKILQEMNYFNNISSFNDKIDELLELGVFTNNDKLRIYDILYEFIDPIEKLVNNETPRVLNSTFFDCFIERKIELVNKINEYLVSNYSELHAFKDFIEFDKNFWIDRNLIMSENISNILQDMKENYIAAILCGAYHRPYLKKLLSDKLKTKIYEYWE